MKPLFLNLLLAVMWLLLSSQRTASVFALGFVLGFALLALFHRVLGSSDYTRRAFALVRFLLIFAWEFIAANGNVVATVLFRSKQSLRPNFITYDVAGLSPFEILLVSHCISLTPGSTTVQVAEDFQTLVLHTLDVHDPAAVRAHIDRVIKRGVLSFTR